MSDDFFADCGDTVSSPGVHNDDKWPDFFRAKEDFSDEDLRTLGLRRAALMILLGLEHRNATDVANEFGVSRQALSKMGTSLARKLPGFDRFIRPQSACDHSADATGRSWASGLRKKKTVTEEAVTANRGQIK